MLYEIDSISAYVFISSACMIGFLFGIYNWYSVASLELKNEDSNKEETREINKTTLENLIDFHEKIKEVKL